ncbi:MAG: ATP-dependent endonuclease [Planctomycetota bacterium]|nr:MAG: ATP-dependent endonuclease [Planctomycetota bacterium]
MPNPKIVKAVVKNYKALKDREFQFNEDLNILVGDNDIGKSTLLESIEIALRSTLRGKPIVSALVPALFNRECQQEYLDGDKSEDSLPEILIELYLDGAPELRGWNNSKGEDAEGISMRICFDTDFSEPYAAFVQAAETISAIPVEFYQCEWLDFAHARMMRFRPPVKGLFLDPSRLHPTLGRSQYIRGILDSALERGERSKLNLAYRELRARFDEIPSVQEVNSQLDIDNDVTDKDLSITADVAGDSSWEANLQIALDSVPFQHAGKGEQSQVQIKLGLLNKANEVDVVMLEEPENHLTHMNLTRLVGYIEERIGGAQVFITTHSSYVLNTLSFGKVCLMGDEYKRFLDLDAAVIRRLQRLPGYDTLRAVLARKVVLVEGPSDELVLKRLYLDQHGVLPEVHGIDVIVVRGIGFKNFLHILKSLGHPVHVVRDNDGDYQANVEEWFAEFEEPLRVFAPLNNADRSLEPSLISENSESVESLDHFARVALSTQTFRAYDTGNLEDRRDFLLDWYAGANRGSKKVDSAARILESDERIRFPRHLHLALTFE